MENELHVGEGSVVDHGLQVGEVLHAREQIHLAESLHHFGRRLAEPASKPAPVRVHLEALERVEIDDAARERRELVVIEVEPPQRAEQADGGRQRREEILIEAELLQEGTVADLIGHASQRDAGEMQLLQVHECADRQREALQVRVVGQIKMSERGRQETDGVKTIIIKGEFGEASVTVEIRYDRHVPISISNGRCIKIIEHSVW